MIQKRKPSLEKISSEFGSSFSVKHYAETSTYNKPPFWHFHPEIELVYVKGGSGKRHIGNHLSYYHSGDLVLIGSMLPHTGFTDRLTGNESETVIQFHEDFLGEQFFSNNEMTDINKLLQRSKAGLAFHGETKIEVGKRLEKLVYLDNFGKMIELLCMLQYMAWTKEYTILNAEGYAIEVQNTDNNRINVIYDFVQDRYTGPISLEEIAEITNMTVPSFCRYFKKMSGKKFTQFVNEIRIVHACKLLTESQDSISNISYASGFNNFSHFNRQFKNITGESPSAYRKKITQVLHEV
jgi:AraC-like DNA-binding protein